MEIAAAPPLAVSVGAGDEKTVQNRQEQGALYGKREFAVSSKGRKMEPMPSSFQMRSKISAGPIFTAEAEILLLSDRISKVFSENRERERIRDSTSPFSVI